MIPKMFLGLLFNEECTMLRNVTPSKGAT